MKKLYPLFILLLSAFALIAQQEQITSLKFNPTVYYSKLKVAGSTRQHKYLVDKGNTIVKTDTLNLPFVDDFSRNRTRSLNYIQNNITDTFYTVIGTCLGSEGITTQSAGIWRTAPSWNYTFNKVTGKVDSTMKPTTAFTFFGINLSDCFSSPPITQFYYPQYYNYTFNDTGLLIDSFLVSDPTHEIMLDTAHVVYFSHGQPGTLWFDDQAYINTTYPINPPTIGVATLDGLNEYGLPYDNSSTSTYGTGDLLTSNPIHLDGYHESDSIYLSFFYEGGGLGDYPDMDDSLIVEMKNNGGAWYTVWADTGYSSPFYLTNQFKQVLVGIPSLPFPQTFFHNNFQFRFRNMSSLYGNNDHWHIDYVKLAANRSAVDTAIHDVAFTHDFPTILKNYTQMPADQFTGAADLRDSVYVEIHNNDPLADMNAPAVNFTQSAVELYPTASPVLTSSLFTFNSSSYYSVLIQPSQQYTIPSATPVDSFVIKSDFNINPNDVLALNDTLSKTQIFSHTMAYDDGTAEVAYGITGVGLKKFGYEFNLNRPDTLVAFQVMFTQVSDNVYNLVFNYEIWDTLVFGNIHYVDAPIFSLVNRKPFYIDSVNGFATYKLDTPIIVPRKIYFGFAQTDERNIQVGYDLNSTLGRPHMYVYRNNQWQASSIGTSGSPMIRMIFGSEYFGDNSATGVIDLTKDKENLTLFPNPTNGHVNIRSERSGATYDITIINTLGQTVQYETAVSDNFNISSLQNGIYIVNARDTQTGKVYREKVIKTTL